MPRNKTSKKNYLLLWSLILLALVVFGGVAYGVLDIITDIPAWAMILISAVLAIGGFALFVRAHRANGFDGVYGDFSRSRKKDQL